jgi:LAS superfamily LD-carboxypeptidase LdcB
MIATAAAAAAAVKIVNFSGYTVYATQHMNML